MLLAAALGLMAIALICALLVVLNLSRRVHELEREVEAFLDRVVPASDPTGPPSLAGAGSLRAEASPVASAPVSFHPVLGWRR
jgi:hypothetical protein